MTSENSEYEGFAILELMGHRRLYGYVSPSTFAGSGVIRIDVPKADDVRQFRESGGGDVGVVTQMYSPNALYCLTPTSQETVYDAVAPQSTPHLYLPLVESGHGIDDELDDDPEDPF